MSFSWRVCRLFAQRTQPREANYVWISDEACNSILQYFVLTRPSRRCVGLAPGPLEARKRATKRRLVGIASPDNAGQRIQDGFQAGLDSWLFGGRNSVPQTYHWLEPSRRRERSVEPRKRSTHVLCCPSVYICSLTIFQG